MGEAPNDTELERLLQRARGGDSDAWGKLVARLQNLVYSVPRRYRLDEDDAGDVFMTSFQALHRNLDRIESGRALPRWLATTAARESLRLVRLKVRTKTEVTLEDLVVQEEATAEAEAIKSDDAFRVQANLASMAARCRDLLSALYGDDEAPYAEIAERLGVPIGAIGPTRARCLEKLRKMMEAEGFFV
jgi:RNA polymerase sigma factor (sigma-70 family)